MIAIAIIIEVLLIMITAWCIIHEDRLICFEREVYDMVYARRVRRAARIVEGAGYRCFPRREGRCRREGGDAA